MDNLDGDFYIDEKNYKIPPKEVEGLKKKMNKAAKTCADYVSSRRVAYYRTTKFLPQEVMKPIDLTASVVKKIQNK
jgi:hypothetical protein